jgi:hypothetical protein
MSCFHSLRSFQQDIPPSETTIGPVTHVSERLLPLFMVQTQSRPYFTFESVIHGQ